MPRPATQLPVLLAAVLPLLCALPARAQDLPLGDLTLGIGLSAGAQYDDRDCKVGGSASTFPGTSTCLLFAGGVDVSLLFRGRIGALVGLYGASGQAAVTQAQAGQQPPPAIPDRVSLPIALDVRPLGFLVSRGDLGFRARLLSGLGLRLGPSLEIVRTASDSDAGAGLYFAVQGEVPLHGAPRHGVSLRLLAHVLYAPQVALNGGSVRTAAFADCDPSTDASCVPPSVHKHGYAPVVQTYLGLVYYP